MNKLLIVYSQLDKPLSGGQVIDFIFINRLVNGTYTTIDYILDKTINGSSIFKYIIYLFKHIKYVLAHDIIFTNSRMYPRLLLCFVLVKIFRNKIKIIAYHHHFNYRTHKGILRVLHKIAELCFLKTMDVILIPSPFVRDEICKILPKSYIQYIEIGFDIKPINSIYKKRTYNLLYVGTVEERKRTRDLAIVAQILKSKNIFFHINVVGSLNNNNYVESLRTDIQKYNLEHYISILGRVDENSLQEMYSKSDIFVFPSSHEGYGMVLIEAMSYGIPVVVYNNSAMPYTVKHKYNGMIAENENPLDFAKNTELLLKDDELYNKLRQGAYNTALNVRTLNDMQKEMDDFIATL